MRIQIDLRLVKKEEEGGAVWNNLQHCLHDSFLFWPRGGVVPVCQICLRLHNKCEIQIDLSKFIYSLNLILKVDQTLDGGYCRN